MYIYHKYILVSTVIHVGRGKFPKMCHVTQLFKFLPINYFLLEPLSIVFTITGCRDNNISKTSLDNRCIITNQYNTTYHKCILISNYSKYCKN